MTPRFSISNEKTQTSLSSPEREDRKSWWENYTQSWLIQSRRTGMELGLAMSPSLGDQEGKIAGVLTAIPTILTS
jgi:hypothetical protein